MKPLYWYQHRNISPYHRHGFEVWSFNPLALGKNQNISIVANCTPLSNGSAEVKNRQLKAANNSDLHFDNSVIKWVICSQYSQSRKLGTTAGNCTCCIRAPAPGCEKTYGRLTLKTPTRRLALYRISWPLKAPVLSSVLPSLVALVAQICLFSIRLCCSR